MRSLAAFSVLCCIATAQKLARHLQRLTGQGRQCFEDRRLVFCRSDELRQRLPVAPAPIIDPVSAPETAGERLSHERRPGGSTLIVEITVKDSNLANRLLSGSWASGAIGEQAKDRLNLIGPVSDQAFDDAGVRLTQIALPLLGRWAKWELVERSPAREGCGDGGVTWSMSVVLANLGASVPEFPRLRVLEIGAGTGLVSLVLSGRGHDVMATDGDDCVLRNLRSNVGTAAGGGRSKIGTRSFRWHVEEDRMALASLGAFDMIVGADLAYDRSKCDALKGSLPYLLPSSDSELVLVERDRTGQSTACAVLLREDGWQVEDITGRGLEGNAVVINGESNPRRLMEDSSRSLLIRVRRKTLSHELPEAQNMFLTFCRVLLIFTAMHVP
ncbi:unnamed protein product [Polarella glacialis]|uniref:Calmodulin-lysine N-methyltransferase n=1 Tax=Polarella glacialis TaxID=89957 RepID=A0A813FRA7_POLGL|nr:unnamed protein product [Polarella glacialis]